MKDAAEAAREALTRFFMRNGDARRLGSGAILQARCAGASRLRALRRYPALPPEELVAILGVADCAEARRRLQRWRRQERILSVKVADRARYPAFQIDPATGQPYPVIKAMLAEFADGVTADWSPYLWLTAPNGLLGDRVPADVIPADPDAVLEAMRIEARGFDA